MLFKIFIFAFGVTLGLALTLPVFAQRVDYDFVAGTDFSSYKTYKWQRAEDARYPDEMINTILMGSIDRELASRGLTRTETDAADIYVIYQFAVIEDMNWSSFKSGGEWQGGFNTNPGFEGVATNSTGTIRKGMLIIDIYDVKQKKQVWQAVAKKTLGKGTDPQKIRKNAQKAMAKIFKNYPPGK